MPQSWGPGLGGGCSRGRLPSGAAAAAVQRKPAGLGAAGGAVCLSPTVSRACQGLPAGLPSTRGYSWAVQPSPAVSQACGCSAVPGPMHPSPRLGRGCAPSSFPGLFASCPGPGRGYALVLQLPPDLERGCAPKGGWGGGLLLLEPGLYTPAITGDLLFQYLPLY